MQSCPWILGKLNVTWVLHFSVISLVYRIINNHAEKEKKLKSTMHFLPKQFFGNPLCPVPQSVAFSKLRLPNLD